MAFEFHLDISLQRKQQFEVTRDYIIPFLQPHFLPGADKKVLDIGCGVGGVLQAFVDAGCQGVGIDLSKGSIDIALQLHQDLIADNRIEFRYQNIYDYDADAQFDLIVFKDSIEHIPDQNKIVGFVKKFLKPNGKIFFGFPPWYMPFGGHQQIIRKSKLFSLLPYYHLLPMPLYRAVLQTTGESPKIIDELIEIKTLGISTYRFEQICAKNKYQILKHKLWLINPIYYYKFKVKPRGQIKPIYYFPYIRDFFSTCAYYIITPQ